MEQSTKFLVSENFSDVGLDVNGKLDSHGRHIHTYTHQSLAVSGSFAGCMLGAAVDRVP